MPFFLSKGNERKQFCLFAEFIKNLKKKNDDYMHICWYNIHVPKYGTKYISLNIYILLSRSPDVSIRGDRS